MGNRLSKHRDAETDIYSYETETNRLLEITGSNPMAFSYDENGNTVNMGNKGFAFNQNNRMIQASADGTPAAGYTYNGFDQRIKKTAGDITTIYHYDQSGNLISESNESGENIIDYIYLGNTRIAAVLSPTGECQGDLDNDGDVDGSDLAVFAVDFGRTDCDTRSPSEDIFGDNNDVDWSDLAVFAGNFGGTDCRAESVYYYHNDHLGTPQKMTDVNGTVVWSADYRPFGQADVTVNTVANNFRFPGQYEDEETGLHYNWHRYYDPGIGKYLRADPIGIQGGINLFAYVSNDPVGGIDTTGLKAICYYVSFNERRNFDSRYRYRLERHPFRAVIESIASVFPGGFSVETAIQHRYFETGSKDYIVIERVCIDECTREFVSRNKMSVIPIPDTVEWAILQEWIRDVWIISGMITPFSNWESVF